MWKPTQYRFDRTQRRRLVCVLRHGKKQGNKSVCPRRRHRQFRSGRGTGRNASWELIYDVGGGIPNGKDFKAAQIGGPSGGCIPKAHLDVPLDYESLTQLGAIMGSGGLIVMDEDTCMVDVARYFLEFVQEESCGKCVPCRSEPSECLKILERICSGKGELSDIDTLVELGNQIKDTALCGLGQTLPIRFCQPSVTSGTNT
jgi:NADH:ubiquinone oxidoreductase subunit F (NADH-binding)